MEYPDELISRAESMFLFDRLEYFQIASETGIPKSVLFKLAEEKDWEQRRANFSAAEKTLLLRKMYNKANKALDENIMAAPQIIYALTNLEKIIGSQNETQGVKIGRQTVKIAGRADAAEALRIAVESQISEMIASGNVDVKKLKGLEESFALIDRLENKGADLPKIFLQNLEFIGEKLAARDPEAVEALAKNFDWLTDEFKKKNTQDL